MNHVSYTEFLNNIEHIIDTAIEYDIFTAINTDKGNVVIISENQFEILIDKLMSR